MAETQSAPLPVPPGFPVEWREPSDDGLFWFQDNLHFPLAVTPANATIFQTAFAEGASRAIAGLSMPISGLRTMVQNGYLYLCPVPVPGTPEELAARFEEMKRIAMHLGSTVLADWRSTFEPQVLAHAERILAFDFDSASIADAARFIESAHEALADVWDIHMRVNIPAMNSVFGFEEFLSHVVGSDAVAQSRLLLQGFDNKSIALGKALWDLSRWVNSTPGLADAVLAGRVRDGGVVLEHPQAGEFSERFSSFLEEFGWRSDVFGEFGHRSWREDPSTPLTQLKAFIRKEDAANPFLAHTRQAAERDQLAAAMAERVPEPLRPQFQAMLDMAQQYIPIAEDHNFTIDQKFTVVMREGMLGLGRKLRAAGAIDDAEDIFFLTLDDIRSLAAGGATGGLRALVSTRRRDFVRQGATVPPPALGTPPPPDAPVDPLVTKFFGFGVVQEGDPKVVTGYPASSGVVTGEAKVAVTLDEAMSKVGPGDILVCRMTMPAWTPLFGVVAAVVSDAGGPLSHCAIVAREYGIPCVAGTQVGTSVIRDGMRIRVDGGTGRVQILG